MKAKTRRFMCLLLAVSVLMSSLVLGNTGEANAGSGQTFTEDFNGFEEGDYPATFDSLTPVSGYTATVEAHPDAENKSLKIERSSANSSKSFVVGKTISANPAKAVILFKAKAMQQDTICYIPTLRGPDGAIIQIAFYSDGKIRVFRQNSWTATGNDLMTYTGDIWYDFKIITDAGTQTLDIYVDGALVKGAVPFQTAQSGLSKIEYGIFRGTSLAAIYVDDVKVYTEQSVTGISMADTEISMKIGEERAINVSVEPADAPYSLVWSSSDETVAAVDPTGKISALQAGQTTVSAIVINTGYKAECTVLVHEGENPGGDEEGETGDLFSESFNQVETSQFPDSLTRPGSVAGYNAGVVEIPDKDNKSLKIERSSANSTASFYIKQMIPENPQKAVITFKAMADQTNVMSYLAMLRGESGAVISQLAFYSDGKIRVFQGSWTAAGNDLMTYTANTWYEFKLVLNAATQKYDIYINDVPVKGQIDFQNTQNLLSSLEFGIYKGTDPAGLYIDDLNIYSYRSVQNVAMDTESLRIATGGSTKINLSITPKIALFCQMEWNSTDEAVVSVDPAGNITALKAGTADITVKVTDLSKVYEATCRVEVYTQPVTEIRLNSDHVEMPVDSERTLVTEILPPDASDKTITWSSDNPSVATVDVNGKIRAVSAGSTVIQAVANDSGGQVSAQCSVTVVERRIQAVYYVSPGGNDGANPGTEESPFRTVEKARDTVRTINEDMSGDILIYLKGGTYVQEQTLTLDERDSGSNGYNVIYRAYPGQTPVISGGKEITGWTLHDPDKNIYRAPSLDIQTRELYINGVRGVRARSEAGLTNAVKTASGFTSEDAFLKDFRNIRDLEFVFAELWALSRCGVDAIEVENGIAGITMKEPGWYAVTHKGNTSVSKGPVYYENAYELLDKGGEWYLDATDGYFYYIPRSTDDMASAAVVAPVLEELVKIEGTSLDTPAHQLFFEGIDFAYTTWLWPSTDLGLADVQNNHLRYPGKDDILPGGAVVVKKANHITFERCKFYKMGSNGLQMIGGVQDSLINGNKFYDLGGSAINVGEPTVNNSNIHSPADERLWMRNVDVTNNYIHDIGVEYQSAAAISAGFPIDMEISHNQIFNIPYTGIHIGYGWYGFVSAGVKDVKVQNNYIHDLLGGLVSDGGAIYTVGYHAVAPDSPNMASGNYIQNQMNRTAVLYADNASDYWIFRDNVVDLLDTPVWPNYDLYWLRGTEEETIWDNNYITSGKVNDLYGTPLNVTNTHVFPDAQWPAEALDIISNSGLEPAYQDLANGSMERVFLPKAITLSSDEEYTLSISATRNKGEADTLSDAWIEYHSENPGIAEVSGNGVITPKITGSTVITTSILKGGIIRTLKTEVYVNDMLETIELKNVAGESKKIEKGGRESVETFLSPYGKTVLGQEVSLENITFISSRPDIVSIDESGVITGLEEGISQITVRGSFQGVEKSRSIEIEVIQLRSDDGLNYAPYYLNEAMEDTENWKVYGGTVSFGDGSVTLKTPSGLGTYEGRKFENELLTFNMEVNAASGWEVLEFRNQDKDKSLQNTYLVTIKPTEIELQRFNDGQRTVLFGNVAGFASVGGEAYPNDVIPFNETRLIQVGAVNEEDGVRIIVNIDGKNVFYFKDRDENRIEEPGYFSVFARFESVTLRKMPEAGVSSPQTVEAGKAVSVTGTIGKGKDFVPRQVILEYDSQLFTYEGSEALADGLEITGEDTGTSGRVTLSFAGSALTVQDTQELFRVNLTAKQTAGETDICLQRMVFSDTGGNDITTVSAKTGIIVIGESDTEDPGTEDPDTGGNTSSGGEGWKEPESQLLIREEAGKGVVEAGVSLDSETSTAKAEISKAAIQKALDLASADPTGFKRISIELEEAEAAKAYELTLPAAALGQKAAEYKMEINAPVARLEIPGNMLGTPGAAGEDSKVTFILGEAGDEELSDEAKAAAGGRPVLTLSVKEDGKLSSWSNPEAPITVYIPYKPSREELKSPEHVVVCYIDDAGNIITIPSGRYDPSAEAVSFTTTHAGRYFISYSRQTYKDLDNYGWAKKPIEVLAAKGVVRGEEDLFVPSKNISRAEFLFQLIKSLSLRAVIEDNFDDISEAEYYYEEIGIAKALGITSGTGGNLFAPDREISRQDMMVLTAKAFIIAGKLTVDGDVSYLDGFSDKDCIAAYAAGSIAALVKEGLIVGNGSLLKPENYTTRAEAAVVLYKGYIR